jgi:multiple sugar transport system permease protein
VALGSSTLDIELQHPAAIRRTRSLFPYLLIAPTMLTLVVVGLIPFLYAVYLSFHDIQYGKVGEFSWFKNYITLLGDGRFWHSVTVALIFISVAVPLEFLLGMVGALVLNQNIKFRRVIIPILLIPTMMAPIVVALLWKIMLAGSWGLISYNVLERFGILGDTSIFGSANLALFALIFIDVWQWTPFMIIAFYAGLQAIPLGPYRAAEVDGASQTYIFTRITLPLMMPLIGVMVLLRLIDAFKVFDTIFLLTGGGPGSATELPSIYGYKLVFEFWKLGPASAFAVVIWVLFFLFCNIFYQTAKKKLKTF